METVEELPLGNVTSVSVEVAVTLKVSGLSTQLSSFIGMLTVLCDPGILPAGKLTVTLVLS